MCDCMGYNHLKVYCLYSSNSEVVITRGINKGAGIGAQKYRGVYAVFVDQMVWGCRMGWRRGWRWGRYWGSTVSVLTMEINTCNYMESYN